MISIDMIIPIPSNGTIKFTNDNSKNNTATNNIYARFAFFPVVLSFKIALEINLPQIQLSSKINPSSSYPHVFVEFFSNFIFSSPAQRKILSIFQFDLRLINMFYP